MVVLETGTFSLFLTIIAIMAIYFSLYLLIVAQKKLEEEKRENKKQEFLKAMKIGLKRDTIKTMEDVMILYKGLIDRTLIESEYRNKLNTLLHKFFAELNTKKIRSVDDAAIKEWCKKISNFIKENEKISPYDDLPSIEKNLLMTIFSSLENNNINTTKEGLKQLTDQIKIRNEDFEQIKSSFEHSQTISKWSLRIAILGPMVTFAVQYLLMK